MSAQCSLLLKLLTHTETPPKVTLKAIFAQLTESLAFPQIFLPKYYQELGSEYQPGHQREGPFSSKSPLGGQRLSLCFSALSLPASSGCCHSFTVAT